MDNNENVPLKSHQEKKNDLIKHLFQKDGILHDNFMRFPMIKGLAFIMIS